MSSDDFDWGQASADFEEHLARQHRRRPQHPDFVRLREVVEQVERFKREGVDADEVYAERIDSYTASYLGAHRMRMNLPDSPIVPASKAYELMTHAWVEGILFGIMFQELGGHRPKDDTP